MIDLRTYELLGIDDHTKKFNDSIKMLKDSLANGITTLVLAPPCSLHRKGDTERFLTQRSIEIEKLKSQQNLPSILWGAKVLMDHDLSLHKNVDKLCIDNGKYLFVELPNFARIPDFDEWIYNLNMKGITPIIAHVDRFPLWKDLIEGLSSVKVYFQVNVSAINNIFKRKVVKKLISHRKKFFISSDSHQFSSTIFNVDVALEKSKRYFPKNFSSFFLSDFNFYI